MRVGGPTARVDAAPALLGAPSGNEAATAERVDHGHEQVVEIPGGLEARGRPEAARQPEAQVVAIDEREARGDLVAVRAEPLLRP